MKLKKSIVLTCVLAAVALFLWLGFRSSTHELGGGLGAAQLKRSFGKITILLHDENRDGEPDWMMMWKWKDAHWSTKSMFQMVEFGGPQPNQPTTWKRWTPESETTKEVANKAIDGTSQ